ncbi:peptidylprolyl isomerase [Porphyromonas gulae]|uniref:peptidylprolyl isomerase n=1 Tax=Porphyromonas gulae TaxID=111105 RepID=A0A0A2FDC0_9PORP|nr:peptidylprolyl isomerase [Porphyromonas gulae]KGN88030.1 peptidylprolyl isomerase [Porphyromonas gulae]
MKRTLFILLVFVACCAAAAQTGEVRHRVLIETSRGKMTVELFNETPIHRDNFITLVRSGAYRGVLFHRVIDQFMVQSGNLLSKNAKPLEDLGNDTTTRTLPAEIDPSKHFHQRGALCAARQGDDVNPEKRSSATQFYIVTGRFFTDFDLERMAEEKKCTFSEEQKKAYMLQGGTPHLDGDYTVFGQLIEGEKTLSKIERQHTDERNRPLKDVVILDMTLLD